MKKTLEEFEESFRRAQGNIKHEGMYLTEEEKELIRQKYMDEITQEEFIQKLIEFAKRDKEKKL